MPRDFSDTGFDTNSLYDFSDQDFSQTLTLVEGTLADFSGALTRFAQGWETDTDGFFDGSNTWHGSIARLASGTDGIASASGGWHARAEQDATSAPFSRYDGYRSDFGGGYRTMADFYLDPTAWADGEGFDVSMAANNQSGTHLRDFIFHVTQDTSTGDMQLGASNNTNFDPREDLENINHAVISSADWYTFEAAYEDDGSGILQVTMTVYDSADNQVFQEVLSNPADDIASTAGGNRYFWLTNIDVATGILLDNITLETIDTAPVQVFSGSDIIGSFATMADAKAAIDAGSIAGSALFMETTGADDGVWYVSSAAGMSIQDAVDAAAMDDTIMISAGVFAESVTVSTALTIMGAGDDMTFVTPGSGHGFHIDGDLGTDATLNISGMAFTGASGSGVHFDDAAILGTLTIDDAWFEDNFRNGVSVGGDYSPVDLDAIEITNSTFLGNGGDGANQTSSGDGDILLFQYGGDALLENLDITGRVRGSGPAENAIQFRGDSMTMGTVVMTNVSMAGEYEKVVFAIYNYDDISGLSGSGNLLTADSTLWDLAVNVDGVGGDIDFSAWGIDATGAPDRVVLQGTANSQTITGGNSDDVLVGKGGADTLIGGDGDDVFVASAGNDTIDGGNGFDLYDLSANNTNGAYVDLATGTGFGGSETGVDSLTSIENVRGGSGVDNLLGDGGENTFFASGSNDVIDGRGGGDFYDATDQTDAVTVDLTTGTASGLLIGTDSLSNIENAAGGSGNDMLTGNSDNNTLEGNDGDDLLAGNGGDDNYWGGDGYDTAIFSGSRDDYSFVGSGGTIEDINISDGDDGEDTLEGIEKLQFSDGNVLIVGGDSEYQTIQSAVDASSDGDLVYVLAGTYREQVTISGRNNLTIRGQEDATIVEMADSPVTNSAGAESVFTVDASSNIVLEDMMVDGRGLATNNQYSGVYFQNSSGTVHDLTVTAIRAPLQGDGSPQGSQLGRAIYANNTDSTARTLTVSDNTITDYQKNGIDLRGVGLDVNVSGNMVEGSGYLPATNAIAQNGIVLVFGVTGTIANNMITEIGYGRGDYLTTGILGFDAGNGVQVTGNTIVGPSTPSFLNAINFSSGEADNVVITGNTIDAALFGVVLNDNVDNPTVSGNVFQNMVTSFTSNNGYGSFIGTNIELYADHNDNAISFAASDGTDVLLGTDLGDVLQGLGGDDFMEGGLGDDTIEGGDGDDSMYYSYGEGHDTVDGGADSDTLFVYVNGAASAVTVDVAGSVSGLDMNVDGNDAADVTNTEEVDLTLSDHGDTVTITGDLAAAGVAASTVTVHGGTGADVIDGNGVTSATHLVLEGADGDDTLGGGAGDDSLDGGAGMDTATFNGNFADYSLTLGASSVTVTDNNAGDGDDGTDTLTGIEKLSFADQTVLVVGSGGYATIQAAVDAASDGDTIHVADGTYTEQVIVDGFNGLSIIATGTATIETPASLSNTAVTLDGRDAHSVVTVLNSADVTLDGFNIDGRGDTTGLSGTSPRFTGVFYQNASGGLNDVNVMGIRDPLTVGGDISGNQRGVGVYVENDAGGARLDFAMTGGSITDFQKNGTVFKHANLNIDGVTVTGGGAQNIIAQNGFQMQDSSGTITNNIVSGIGYAGPSVVYAGGMLAFDNVDLDITNNMVTGTNSQNLASKGIGIYVSGADDGSVTGNTVDDMDLGIAVYGSIGPDQVDLNSNTVTNVDFTDAYAAGVDHWPGAGVTTPFDVEGSETDDWVGGGDSDDILRGLGGDDGIYGWAGNDEAYGGDGDDYIDTGDGDDYADGGNDDDTFQAGAGDDEIVGGAGIDTYDATGIATRVTVDLLNNPFSFIVAGTGFASGNDVDTDGLTGIENVRGGDGDDIISGDGNDNVIFASLGFDQISGGVGTDTFDASDATAMVTVRLNNGTASGADIDNNSLSEIENAMTGAGDDLLSGDSADNLLDGGDGTDVYDATYAAAVMTVDLSTGTTSGADIGVDTLVNIENVTAGAGNDVIIGDAGDNVLSGRGGNDKLYGEGGNDTLQGNQDRDVLTGGAGADVLDGAGDLDWAYYNDSDAAVTIDLGAGTASGGYATGDTFIGIERLLGSVFGDTLTGDSGGNFIRAGNGMDTLNGGDGTDYLEGGRQADIIDGGDGIDWAYYWKEVSGVTVDLDAGTASDGDTLTSIERLRGSDHADTLIGNSENNYFRGGDGDDFLDGAEGRDVLFGEGGADTFIFEAGDEFARIRDFEDNSDSLDLTDFGLSSQADAALHMTQSGSDVFFNFAGERVIVENITIADLQDDVLV